LHKLLRCLILDLLDRLFVLSLRLARHKSCLLKALIRLVIGILGYIQALTFIQVFSVLGSRWYLSIRVLAFWLMFQPTDNSLVFSTWLELIALEFLPSTYSIFRFVVFVFLFQLSLLSGQQLIPQSASLRSSASSSSFSLRLASSFLRLCSSTCYFNSS